VYRPHLLELTNPNQGATKASCLVSVDTRALAGIASSIPKEVAVRAKSTSHGCIWAMLMHGMAMQQREGPKGKASTFEFRCDEEYL
jgi:hypothetical protein